MDGQSEVIFTATCGVSRVGKSRPELWLIGIISALYCAFIRVQVHFVALALL